MLRFLSRFWRTSVVGTFVAGLFFLLPIVVTIFIVVWLVDWLKAALGPGTFLGELITQSGKVLIGREYEYIAFALGVLITMLGVWMLGLIVRSQARKGLESAFDSAINRVPLFRSIYKPVARIVRFASSEHAGEELAGMSVVRCRFGALGGVETLALLASSDTYLFDGIRSKLVYFPTSPMPMTGYLLFVPEQQVLPVPGMQVEQLMKIYITLGTLAPENIPSKFLAPRDRVGDIVKAFVDESEATRE
jgi:uncharacterized membrane protein